MPNTICMKRPRKYLLENCLLSSSPPSSLILPSCWNCHSLPRKQHQTSFPHRPQALLWDLIHIINPCNNTPYNCSLPPAQRFKKNPERTKICAIKKKRLLTAKKLSLPHAFSSPLVYVTHSRESFLLPDLPASEDFLLLCDCMCISSIKRLWTKPQCSGTTAVTSVTPGSEALL